MARRSKAATPPPEDFSDDASADSSEPPAAELEDDAQLADLSESMQPESDALIYRMRPNQKPSYLDTVRIADLSEKFLADNYGGGVYSIRPRRAGAHGRLVFAGRLMLEVDASIPQRAPGALPAPAAVPAPAAGSTTRDSILDTGLLTMMRSMQEMQTIQLEAMRAAVSNGGMLEKLLPALLPLAAPLIEGMLKRPDPTKMLAESLAMLREVQGPPPAAGGLSKMLEDVRALREVSSMFDGDGGAPRAPGLMDTILAKITPGALEAITKALAARSMPVAPSVSVMPPPHGVARAEAPTLALAPDHAPVAPAAVIAAPPVPALSSLPDDSPMLALAPILPALLKQLLAWAQLDRDPSVYAQVAIDQTPPQFRNALRVFVARADAADVIVLTAPTLAAHHAWLTELIEEAREIFGFDTPARADSSADTNQPGEPQ